jgi:ABC-type methionine transport system ATPase subunit
VPILRDVSLAVPRGAALSLVGPSGAGKSSLLRLWNGLDPHDSGRVLVDGVDAGTIAPTELRRRTGLVFQIPRALAPSVLENVLYGPRLRLEPAATGTRGRDLAAAELARVGLPADLLARAMSSLSVGEQQRVAIARALANRPEALLLDEPTASLDPRATREILELLARLRAELGLTLVFVSHALEQARAVATRVALLVGGEVVEEAPAGDFFERPRDPRTRAFLDGELGRASA